jgi:hypothetical protein
MFDLEKTKALGRLLLEIARPTPEESHTDWARRVKAWGVENHTHPAAAELQARFFRGAGDAREFTFLVMWAMNGFPRLLLDKLQAYEFISTNAGDDPEVMQFSPWSAYLIEIPHDVLQVPVDGRMTSFDVIHVLDADDQRGFVVRGHHSEHAISGRLAFPLPDWSEDRPRVARENESALDRVHDAAAHLIISAEIEMNDREQLIELKPKNKMGKSLNPPGTYKLARVVTIDCSEHVKEYLSGERRTVRAARWLTRGHGKMQPHGPNNSLRKPIRRAPFWNPRDQELPVAERPHRLRKKKRR